MNERDLMDAEEREERLRDAAEEMLAALKEALDYLEAAHKNLTNGEWDDEDAHMIALHIDEAIVKAQGRE